MTEFKGNKVPFIGIRLKLLVTIIGLMTSLMATLSFTLTQAQVRQMQKDLDQSLRLRKDAIIARGIAFSQNLKMSAEQNIAAFNFSNLSDVLHTVVEEDSALAFAVLMDTKRVAYVHTANPMLEKDTLDSDAAKYAVHVHAETRQEYGRGDTAVMEFIQPIHVGTDQWGVLRLGMSLAPLNETLLAGRRAIEGEIRDTISQSVFVLILFLFAGSIFVHALSSRLSDPLQRLTLLSQKLARGDFRATRDVVINTRDEVGVLADGLNTMASKLEHSYQELEASNTLLEERVLARTSELASANDQLRAEIAERVRTESELREALLKLEKHHEAKTEFVVNVSHELKTPIASMTQALLNLRSGLVGPLSDPVMDYLRMINEDCRRLRGTISDILDLSRIESHTLVLDRTLLPFARFIRGTAESIAVQAFEKQIEFRICDTDTVGFALLDVPKMERVVLNVIQNALKYTPSGGWVEVRVASDRDSVSLYVTDSGPGIPVEHLRLVFDRYYRIGEHVSGSGLGLAISKEIVALHDGTIEILSPVPNRDSGTQVDIRLTRVSPAHVLVLGFLPEYEARLEKDFSIYGYRVTLRADVGAALDALRAISADIVVLNLNATEALSTIEVLACLATDAEFKDLALVGCIGEKPHAAITEILHGSAIPIINEDWEIEDLMGGIEDALRSGA